MGNTPLFYAAMVDALDCVEYLLELGADPHAKNKAGSSVWELANQYQRHELITLINKYQ